MTDAYLDEVMGHPRDEHGRLIPPRRRGAPATLAEALASASAAFAAFGIPAGQREGAYEAIRSEYGAGG
jgi:hypothetical protein